MVVVVVLVGCLVVVVVGLVLEVFFVGVLGEVVGLEGVGVDLVEGVVGVLLG